MFDSVFCRAFDYVDPGKGDFFYGYDEFNLQIRRDLVGFGALLLDERRSGGKIRRDGELRFCKEPASRSFLSGTGIFVRERG